MRTQLNEATKLTALTNIFEDIQLAKCLLDQDYNQTVRLFIQRSALNWNFNSFTFDALCCGRSLTELLLHLFDYYNLYTTFNLDIIKVLKCFRLLEFGYHSTNPYHNSVHAADVTQAMHCFIQENKIRKHMTNLEILCSILAAVCHDLDHPGVNQSFLVATKNPLADLYRNISVLENHHWRFALCIFRESQLFDHFHADVLEDMKEQLKHLILATDIARQNEYLKRFRELTSSQQFSMSNTNDRALVLQMALKCADLGNPCRPWMISRVWSNLICDEFYRMGQIERRLGVPLTPVCQRDKTSIAGIQTDFFRYIVLPLLELWHGFLSSPLSDLLMANFDHNYKRWQRASRIVQQLRRRKSVACLEPVEANVDPEASAQARADAQTGAAHQWSSWLFVEPELTARHSFGAVKRASSDYIKSGNGRLEVLRDFQLNRMIERSPHWLRAQRRGGGSPAGEPAVSSRRASAESAQYMGPISRDFPSVHRKLLSPIQDGDGPSPENLEPMAAVKGAASPSRSYTEAASYEQESSVSSPGSRASSACSSPVGNRMRSTFIPARSLMTEPALRQQQRKFPHHPYAKEHYEPAGCKLAKHSNLPNRQSVSVSELKTIRICPRRAIVLLVLPSTNCPPPSSSRAFGSLLALMILRARRHLFI